MVVIVDVPSLGCPPMGSSCCWCTHRRMVMFVLVGGTQVLPALTVTQVVGHVRMPVSVHQSLVPVLLVQGLASLERQSYAVRFLLFFTCSITASDPGWNSPTCPSPSRRPGMPRP